MKKNNKIFLAHIILEVTLIIFVSSIFGIGYSIISGPWSYLATAWCAMWLYNKCFHQLNTKEVK